MALQHVIYCHGIPGLPNELDRYDEDAAQSNPAIVPVPLLDLAAKTADFDAALTEWLLAQRKHSGNHSVSIIGFSLGAMAAIKLAANNPEYVSDLTLISPAAPLQSGDHLRRMAGRFVFRSAMQSNAGLNVLTAAQDLAARLAPHMMIRALFAESPASEKLLATDANFATCLRDALRSTYGPYRTGYCAYLRTYVSDWRSSLVGVRCPVVIWQGMHDNWTPPSMADALYREIPVPVDIKWLENTGHFGALVEFRKNLKSQADGQITRSGNRST